MDFVIKYLCFAALTLGAVAAMPAKWWRPGWLNTVGMAAWFVVGAFIFLS